MFSDSPVWLTWDEPTLAPDVSAKVIRNPDDPFERISRTRRPPVRQRPIAAGFPLLPHLN